jgi:hypothetical protein
MKPALKLSVFCAACAALLAAASPAQAFVAIAPPAPGMRVAQSSTIVVGKIESIEEKTVKAPRFPGDKEKAEYQVAVIKISDPILGAKGLTHVRVGFLPVQMGGPGGPGRPIRGLPPVNLTKDQEVLIFLSPHFDANFMVASSGADVIDKKANTNFDKEVAEAKKLVKLLAAPKDGLTSKDAEERLLAAALLISQYRTQKPSSGQPKTEAVDAEISKLILNVLADADWKSTVAALRTNPQNMFSQLGINEKDGWTPPMTEVMGRKQIDYQKMPEAMKKWCKDNAEKYKIQRFVYEEKKEEAKDK